ncbi:MAG: sulfate/molybdate ABC transporter ATP-binding protein [Deltaproteobacteria bacterium]|nr:sulfate/molybdate ABC transporter ATP-binding protein [Deltaproteobacteria bacterium]
MTISVSHVVKRFGDFLALDDVSLEVPDGALLALLGPSGCGKTTLLRIIAGLEVADAGRVLHHAEDVTHDAAQDRNVGFVFQHYALFRHMTIADNIGYGLRVRGVGDRERAARVDELLHLIRLDGHGDRYPSQLSGGQRQRVALARALAARPRVLLLDEPFGALDAKVRQELRRWLRRLHEEIHVTSVFVTHDQEEAFEVADRVVVMNRGRIEQAGTPADVFEQPANAFVMDFLGNVNRLPGRGETVFVRPHEMKIARERGGDGSLAATIVHVNPTGPMVKVQLRAVDHDALIDVEVPAESFAELALAHGDTVHVSPRRVRVFADAAS